MFFLCFFLYCFSSVDKTNICQASSYCRHLLILFFMLYLFYSNYSVSKDTDFLKMRAGFQLMCSNSEISDNQKPLKELHVHILVILVGYKEIRVTS